MYRALHLSNDVTHRNIRRLCYGVLLSRILNISVIKVLPVFREYKIMCFEQAPNDTPSQCHIQSSHLFYFTQFVHVSFIVSHTILCHVHMCTVFTELFLVLRHDFYHAWQITNISSGLVPSHHTLLLDKLLHLFCYQPEIVKAYPIGQKIHSLFDERP